MVLGPGADKMYVCMYLLSSVIKSKGLLSQQKLKKVLVNIYNLVYETPVLKNVYMLQSFGPPCNNSGNFYVSGISFLTHSCKEIMNFVRVEHCLRFGGSLFQSKAAL